MSPRKGTRGPRPTGRQSKTRPSLNIHRGRILRTPEKYHSGLSPRSQQRNLINEQRINYDLINRIREKEIVKKENTDKNKVINIETNNKNTKRRSERNETIENKFKLIVVKIKLKKVLKKVLQKQCDKLKYIISTEDEKTLHRRIDKLIDMRLKGLNTKANASVIDLMKQYRQNYPEEKDKKTINVLLKELLEGYETVSEDEESIETNDIEVSTKKDTDAFNNGEDFSSKKDAPSVNVNVTPLDNTDRLWKAVEEVLQDVELDIIDKNETSSDTDNIDSCEEQVIKININFVSRKGI